MSGARLNLTGQELAVLAEALREALAAELLRVESAGPAQELLERIDAKLPSVAAHHATNSPRPTMSPRSRLDAVRPEGVVSRK